MRNRLKKLLGNQYKFSGKVTHIRDNSVMVTSLKKDGKNIADHVWFNVNDIKNFLFGEGEIIYFYATPRSYVTSNGERNYGLHKVHRFTHFEGLEETSFYRGKRR